MHPRSILLLVTVWIGTSFPPACFAADETLVPTARSPIAVTDAIREQARARLRADARLPPEEVTPHPAAAEFPGNVPPDAERVTREIRFQVPADRWRANGVYANARSNVWHSTGLYAAAGDVITVALATELTDARLRVRIGCHKDRLWHKPRWSRIPEITRTWPLEGETTRVASAFGGLIYIEVPFDTRRREIGARISGGVPAPWFVLGQTSLKEWTGQIRDNPAPWAELASDKLIISVPSSAVRTLDDPETLMRLWDRVLDAQADLATWPRERFRAERFVTDVQISAGYMHSGYPLMTGLDVVETFLNPKRLRANSHGGIWGFYHELGHNHQSSDWTFAGSTEVTVNLFTLYVYHEVFENKLPRPEIYGAGRARTLKRYLARGARFNDWKRDPFLALIMYMQLQEAFGWKVFQKVFAEYRALPRGEKRWSDDRKRDEWLVRFSRAADRNLGPFFEAWGVPTSEEARAGIADLKEWMPPDWPAN